MVATGFKCYIGCGTRGSVTGLTQCIDFRMGLTGFFVETTSNHLAIKADDTADTRIGMACFQPQAGQLQGIGHALVIKPIEAHYSSSPE